MCKCVIVDFVFDYDFKFGWIFVGFVDVIIDYVESYSLRVDWILEIYVYVDYLMVVFYL